MFPYLLARAKNRMTIYRSCIAYGVCITRPICSCTDSCKNLKRFRNYSTDRICSNRWTNCFRGSITIRSMNGILFQILLSYLQRVPREFRVACLLCKILLPRRMCLLHLMTLCPSVDILFHHDNDRYEQAHCYVRPYYGQACTYSYS